MTVFLKRIESENPNDDSIDDDEKMYPGGTINLPTCSVQLSSHRGRLLATLKLLVSSSQQQSELQWLLSTFARNSDFQ